MLVIMFSRIWNSFLDVFRLIDLRTLWSSFIEIIWQAAIAFIPLGISVYISRINDCTWVEAFTLNVVPGEMIAFALGFIANNFFLFATIQDGSYKLPWVKFVFLMTIAVYVSTLILWLIAKNGWVIGINMEPGKLNLYFWSSISLLLSSFVIWWYATYHNSRRSNYGENLRHQSDQFNAQFVNSVQQQGGSN